MSEINKIEMTVNYRKNKNTKSEAYGKYYAEVAKSKTLTTRGLAELISQHNSGVGRADVQAVIVKLSEMIPQLVAQGQRVKLDGLGTFYPTIATVEGGATEAQMKDKEFNPTSIIEGVRLRFRPTGDEMDNHTSKQYLTRSVSVSSANIIEAVERTIEGKTKTVQVITSLEDFRNPEPQP